MTSAVGSRLTRQEWNVAYFLGLHEVVEGRFRGGFDDQVRRGFELLAAGGCVAGSPGSSGDRAFADEHALAAREMAGGEFDTLERAREALVWLRKEAPGIDATWLRGLLNARERARGTFGRGPRFQAGRDPGAEARA